MCLLPPWAVVVVSTARFFTTSVSFCHHVHLSIYLSIHLPIYLPTESSASFLLSHCSSPRPCSTRTIAGGRSGRGRLPDQVHVPVLSVSSPLLLLRGIQTGHTAGQDAQTATKAATGRGRGSATRNLPGNTGQKVVVWGFRRPRGPRSGARGVQVSAGQPEACGQAA